MNKTIRKLAYPYYGWLYLLAIVPIAIMLVLVFFDIEGIGFSEARFTFRNFALFLEPSTLEAFGNSFLFATTATLVSAVLGYIVAYQVFRSRFRNKFIILTLFILPMWSNMLLRTEALGNIMERHNIFTDLLGIPGGFNLRGTGLAVLIGLVITYLPFMILPIYTALEKIDPSLEEAALDLGVTEMRKFWKVVFPLSIKGVITGCIMVFLPCLSGFAIPEILGNGNIMLIGNIIEQSFRNMSYNLGSLLAITILFFIFGSLMIVNKVDKEGGTLI
ncbi:MAG TPA: ABC transporter permease [Bacilli bacterium]|jgi:spermidine/putrescine transport system permease protein|nr:MAG: Putrescine transport system permease protein PotH [Tenericutes bacterium ADurb.Bin140]HOE77328.1 ABC transporter permease [Bacilli bacterium]HPD11896.1 ABC transporter permease [Bacilli bacterium]HPK58257.1 ABC transporter permease [Bacilli bacterium]HPX19907.1 ABC transporter permease [Bacilli bacterium]